jgi:hypothetical protein
MFGKETTHVSDTESSAYIRSKFREFNRQRGVVIRACEEVFDSVALRRTAAAKQGLHAIWKALLFLQLPVCYCRAQFVVRS